MSYLVFVTNGPGLMTSRLELQAGTAYLVPVDIPLGGSGAVLQRQKWCCCRPIVVVVPTIMVFTGEHDCNTNTGSEITGC